MWFRRLARPNLTLRWTRQLQILFRLFEGGRSTDEFQSLFRAPTSVVEWFDHIKALIRPMDNCASLASASAVVYPLRHTPRWKVFTGTIRTVSHSSNVISDDKLIRLRLLIATLRQGSSGLRSAEDYGALYQSGICETSTSPIRALKAETFLIRMRAARYRRTLYPAAFHHSLSVVCILSLWSSI